jgi:hypothetical protein
MTNASTVITLTGAPTGRILGNAVRGARRRAASRLDESQQKGGREKVLVFARLILTQVAISEIIVSVQLDASVRDG